MNTNKKLLLFFLIICLIGLGSIFLLPKDKYISNTENNLRIGAGDDITGVLLQRIIKTSEIMGEDNLLEPKAEKEIFEAFSFKDC